jgi:hypothetical protein
MIKEPRLLFMYWGKEKGKHMHLKFSIFAAALFLGCLASAAQAEVTTETVTQRIAPGVKTLHFMDFDLNGDGILSLTEVGELLFNLFDLDGNDVIDNVEYEKRSVLTVAPVEEETTIVYDFDNDGLPDKIQRTFDTFLKETQLARFDRNKDGLSPHEFTGKSFLNMDVDKSKAIELAEWRGAYISSIDEANRRAAETNK